MTSMKIESSFRRLLDQAKDNSGSKKSKLSSLSAPSKSQKDSAVSSDAVRRFLNAKAEEQKRKAAEQKETRERLLRARIEKHKGRVTKKIADTFRVPYDPNQKYNSFNADTRTYEYERKRKRKADRMSSDIVGSISENDAVASRVPAQRSSSPSELKMKKKEHRPKPPPPSTDFASLIALASKVKDDPVAIASHDEQKSVRSVLKKKAAKHKEVSTKYVFDNRPKTVDRERARPSASLAKIPKKRSVDSPQPSGDPSRHSSAHSSSLSTHPERSDKTRSVKHSVKAHKIVNHVNGHSGTAKNDVISNSKKSLPAEGKIHRKPEAPRPYSTKPGIQPKIQHAVTPRERPVVQEFRKEKQKGPARSYEGGRSDLGPTTSGSLKKTFAAQPAPKPARPSQHASQTVSGKSSKHKEFKRPLERGRVEQERLKSKMSQPHGGVPHGKMNNSFPQGKLKKETQRPQTPTYSKAQHVPQPKSASKKTLVGPPPFLSELMRKPVKPLPTKEVYRQDELAESDLDVEDEEDDSDLADFIDDSEAPDAGQELSETLKEVFGYDKSKYAGDRFDSTKDMESSFGDIMKEEARTARLGRLEDLKELKREMKELKRELKREG